MRIIKVKISSISIPENYPRNIQKIAESIPTLRSQYSSTVKTGIQIPPIQVSQMGANDNYLVHGLKRLLGAREAGEEHIFAIITPMVKARHAMFIQIANDSSSNPIDRAKAMSWLIHSNYNATDVALLSGLGSGGREIVNKMIRLLTLPHPVQEYIEQGLINFEHANELLGLDAQLAHRLTQLSIEEDMSITELRDVKSRWLNTSIKKSSYKRLQDNKDHRELLDFLFDRYGIAADIKLSESGLKLSMNLTTIESFSKLIQAIAADH